MAQKKGSMTKGGGFFGDLFGGVTNLISPLIDGKAAPGAASDVPDVVPTGPKVPTSRQPQTTKAIDSAPYVPTTYADFVSKKNKQSVFAEYSRGYEAEFAKNSHTSLGKAHNGTLSFDGAGESIPLFVYDLSLDFVMNGGTQQSSKGAVFYPKNFRQSDLLVQCQAPNPLYYGKAVEAIRDSQMPSATIARLTIKKGGTPTKFNTRGDHEGIEAVGYVSLIARKHTRFVYSPEFEIRFTVVQFLSPTAWAGSVKLKYTVNADWHNLIAGAKGYDRDYEAAPEFGKTAEDFKRMAEAAANRSQNTSTSTGLSADRLFGNTNKKSK